MVPVIRLFPDPSLFVKSLPHLSKVYHFNENNTTKSLKDDQIERKIKSKVLVQRKNGATNQNNLQRT